MKFKPPILFITLTVLLLMIGMLKRGKTIDIQLHDTYFIIDYLHIAIILGFLTGLMAMLYYGFERVKRPVKLKTGFWHFGLFATGLLLLVIIINLPAPNGYQRTNIYSSTALLFIGLVLLLTSVIVFLFGLIKAILSKHS